MVTIGIDAHKHSHTAVACDEHGRELARRRLGTSSREHRALLAWAASVGEKRRYAVEDCRALSRRLERDLLGAGEEVLRVPPKLMAKTRSSARTYGKSDAIDALAIARACLREPALPSARLDGKERELRLLLDYREGLVAERTRLINRLRWRLHELDPALEADAGALTRRCRAERLERALAGCQGLVARLARAELGRCRELTAEVDVLAAELEALVTPLAPALVAIVGCGPLTAAKILAETAGIERFRSPDAYARHNGTAPLPVASAGVLRHRLSRAGNRQLNAALHRIALVNGRFDARGQALLARRRTQGDSPREALRVLKRRLSDVVYRALMHDREVSLQAIA
jgi:transposase